MPKKPRHIQDRVDQLINEKYTAKEIIEKIKNEGHSVSGSYISNRRKKIKKPEIKQETSKPTSQELSKNSINLLYRLMGLLGLENLDETVKTLNSDYTTIMEYKYRYDLLNEKTVSDVFLQFEEAYDIISKLDEDESQKKIFMKLGLHVDLDGVLLTSSLGSAHDYYRWIKRDGDFNGSFFEFLSEYSIRCINELDGLSVGKYMPNRLLPDRKDVS